MNTSAAPIASRMIVQQSDVVLDDDRVDDHLGEDREQQLQQRHHHRQQHRLHEHGTVVRGETGTSQVSVGLLSGAFSNASV